MSTKKTTKKTTKVTVENPMSVDGDFSYLAPEEHNPMTMTPTDDKENDMEEIAFVETQPETETATLNAVATEENMEHETPFTSFADMGSDLQFSPLPEVILSPSPILSQEATGNGTGEATAQGNDSQADSHKKNGVHTKNANTQQKRGNGVVPLPLTLDEMKDSLRCLLENTPTEGDSDVSLKTWKPEQKKSTQIDEWEILLAQEIGALFGTIPFRTRSGMGFVGTSDGIEKSLASYRLIRDEVKKSSSHPLLSGLFSRTLKTPERLNYYKSLISDLRSTLVDLPHSQVDMTTFEPVLKQEKIAPVSKTYQHKDGTKATMKVFVQA